MDKESALEKLHEQIKSCNACPLHVERIQAVPGVGSAQAQIVFIGEGPGATEDKKGEPFVGAAGKFLDEMLVSVKMDRSKVFITNIVKCRPPGNRDPLPEEVSTCSSSFLWKQLELINPNVVITLGRHAMHRFLSEEHKIGDVHGEVFPITSPESGKHFNLIPLYHPAAALYNGSMREVLMADFETVPKIIKKIQEEGIKKTG